MKMIKEIKFFKGGSFSVTLNKTIDTTEEYNKFNEELKEYKKKNKKCH